PPSVDPDAPYNILVAGIGGTGVITIGALLGMAAHLDSRGCSALDFTGLAQKNGAVMSHVRIAPQPEDIASVRITSGGADLILGCDIVVAASETALNRVDRGVTRAFVNADLQPTASNGAASESNKQAFPWGRLAAHDMARVRGVIQFRTRAASPTRTLDEQIAYRAKFLSEYQDQAYADRYVAAVDTMRKAETAA